MGNSEKESPKGPEADRLNLVSSAGGKLFPKTSQTLLGELQGIDELKREVSLARFCAIYYPSIYGFARMMGFSIEDAQDRTQDFFVKIVEERLLQKFDPSKKARLSSWLIKCFKNMALHHLEAERAKKRGGGLQFVELDSLNRGVNIAASDGNEDGAIDSFDRVLADQIWSKVATLLREKHNGKASQQLAEELIPFLAYPKWPLPPAPSQSEVAARCGVTAKTLKAFLSHTLRKQAKRLFVETARIHCQRISDEEAQHLWNLLRID